MGMPRHYERTTAFVLESGKDRVGEKGFGWACCPLGTGKREEGSQASCALGLHIIVYKVGTVSLGPLTCCKAEGKEC